VFTIFWDTVYVYFKLYIYKQHSPISHNCNQLLVELYGYFWHICIILDKITYFVMECWMLLLILLIISTTFAGHFTSHCIVKWQHLCSHLNHIVKFTQITVFSVVIYQNKSQKNLSITNLSETQVLTFPGSWICFCRWRTREAPGVRWHGDCCSRTRPSSSAQWYDASVPLCYRRLF